MWAHHGILGFEIFLVKIVSYEKVLPADRGLGHGVLGCELLFYYELSFSHFASGVGICW